MARDETRPELPRKVALSLIQGTAGNYWTPVIGDFNPDALDRDELECVEYRPVTDLAAAEARIRDLEQLLDSERRHSSALMARINERTNPRPTLLEVIDDHD